MRDRQIFPTAFAAAALAAQQGLALQPWGGDPAAQGFQGGDLYGVIRGARRSPGTLAHLPLSNPVFAQSANHGYHTFEYFPGGPAAGRQNGARPLW